MQIIDRKKIMEFQRNDTFGKSSNEYKKKNRYKILLIIINGLLLSYAAYSFIITPLNGDVEVFIAAARQAKFNDKFELLGVIKTWELKGIGSRLFYWLLYKVTLVFVEYGTYKFSLLISFFYVLIISGVLATSCYLFNNKLKNPYLCNILFTFMLGGILNSYCWDHMQHEMTGVVILILAVAVYLSSDNRKWKFLAGVIFGSVFYFKSVLLVMGLSYLGSIFLLEREKKVRDRIIDTIYYLIGAGSIVFGGIILLLLFYPREIMDMLDASRFQSTLLSIGFENIHIVDIMKSLLKGYVDSCISIPVLFIGVSLSIMLIVNYICKKNYFKLFCLGMVWISPCIFIILSNCFFAYHFLTFVFSSIIVFIDYIKEESEKKINGCWEKDILLGQAFFAFFILFTKNSLINDYIRKEKTYYIIMLIIVIILLGSILLKQIYGLKRVLRIIITFYTLFLCFYFTSAAAPFVKFARMKTLEVYERQSKMLEKMEGNTIMYLGGGSAPYYIGAKSYLRYFYPLPLQRISYGSENAKLECYQDSYEKMINYDGKYIICDEKWFFTNNEYLKLKEKLNRDYVESKEKLLYTYFTWGLFDYEEYSYLGEEKIYVRK